MNTRQIKMETGGLLRRHPDNYREADTEAGGRGEREIKMSIFVKIAAFCNVFILQKKEAS